MLIRLLKIMGRDRETQKKIHPTLFDYGHCEIKGLGERRDRTEINL